MVKIANARCIRDITTKNRIRKSVIEPVSNIFSKIEDNLLHCIEDEVDIAALRKEHHTNRKMSDLIDEDAVAWT